jgi:hypothetical protein
MFIDKDISEYHNYWSKNTASTPIKGHFWISQLLEKKYRKHTNQRTFLNITTTGVKIPQAHQSKDISEYHNYWCIFTPVVVIFRNVLWLVCLRYFYSSSCDIQKCPLIEYHNYWSKNTASTPIKGHFWISQLLEWKYSKHTNQWTFLNKCPLIGVLAVFLLQ